MANCHSTAHRHTQDHCHSHAYNILLMCAQLEATGLQSREADAAASQLGKAIGMAALLRGTGYHASRSVFL